MAQSAFKQRQVSSECFVESCGAILFDLSGPEKRLCLIHYAKRDEWLLAKGRRNCGESRKDAALREMMEETGYRCHLLPISMPTRATAPNGPADISDKARMFPNLTEPFMFTMRELRHDNGVKLIWWFIAILDENAENDRLPGETDFKASFFPLSEAVERLTFQSDREVVEKAIDLVEKSMTKSQ